MWTLAIDFGTSNTAGAVAVDSEPLSLEVSGERTLPSVVLLAEDGHLVVGQEALNQAVIQYDRVERAPKRRLGKVSSLLLGGEAVPLSKAVGALMTPFIDEASRRRNGEKPARVTLTHPARWSDERLGALREAGESVGLTDIQFCAEPVAAAVFYADEHLTDGHYVAVYDLGGGTFDTAVLRRTTAAFEVVGDPGGLENLGGEDFDQRLFDHFGSILARDDAALWEELTTSDERKWKRAYADLWAQSRQAKESLSRNTTGHVFVQVADRDLHITRDEFEDLIRTDIERTVDELERTIQATGLAREYVARVYLTGGASRIPLVQQLLTERFGDRLVTWDDPKCVVAKGAAKLAATLLEADRAEAAARAPSVPGPPRGSQPVPGPPPPGSRPVPGPPPPGRPAGGPPTGPTPPVYQPPATPRPAPPVYSPPVPPRPDTPAPPVYSPPAPPRANTPAPPVYQPPAAPRPPAYPQNPANQPNQHPQNPPGGPVAGAPPYGYPPAGQSGSGVAKPPGRDKTNLAWVMAVLGFVTCFTPALGIYFANEGKKLGDPQAQSAMIVNILMLLMGFGFAFLVLIALGSSGGGSGF